MGAQMERIVEGRWISFFNGLPNHITNSLTVDGLVCECPKVAVYSVWEANKASLNDAVNKLILPKTVSLKNVYAADGVTPLKPDLAVQQDAFESVEYICE